MSCQPFAPKKIKQQHKSTKNINFFPDIFIN